MLLPDRSCLLSFTAFAVPSGKREKNYCNYTKRNWWCEAPLNWWPFCFVALLLATLPMLNRLTYSQDTVPNLTFESGLDQWLIRKLDCCIPTIIYETWGLYMHSHTRCLKSMQICHVLKIFFGLTYYTAVHTDCVICSYYIFQPTSTVKIKIWITNLTNQTTAAAPAAQNAHWNWI